MSHPEKHPLLSKKTSVVTFGQLMEQIGLLFISTSGHTDDGGGVGWYARKKCLPKSFRPRGPRKLMTVDEIKLAKVSSLSTNALTFA